MPSSDTSKGPQEDCFNLADEQHRRFFIAKQYAYKTTTGDVKTAYSYEAYKTVHNFIEYYTQVSPKNRTFMELIRENRPCLEYYDIEWKLDAGTGFEQQEQTMLTHLLEFRNLFAPECPVNETHCRVTSASSIVKKKGSIHVVVFSDQAFHNNHIDLKFFMNAFRTFIQKSTQNISGEFPGASIDDSIDWNVYTRNRLMRCLGNAKCTELDRPFVKAAWHIPSMEAAANEFYITNILQHVKLINLGSIAQLSKNSEVPKSESNISINKALSKNLKFKTTSVFSEDQKETAESLKNTVMKIFRESQISKDMIDQFDATSLVPIEGGVRVVLTRKLSGHCILCKRVHDSDNAFLQINLLGKIFYACHRNHHKRELIGRLKGENKIQERDLICLSSDDDDDFNADEEYSERFLKYSHIQKSLIIRSPTGSGKTRFLESFIRKNPNYIYVAITCRKTLADHLCNLPDFVSYLDSKTGQISGNRIVIQAESLWRLSMDFYNQNQDKLVLILDEFCSLKEQFTSHSTMGRNHNIVCKLFELFLRQSYRIIALDADFTSRDVNLLRSVRSDLYVIHNSYKIHAGDSMEFYASEKLLHSKILQALTEGKKLWIASTHSAKHTKAIHLALKEKGFKGACMTKMTSEVEKRKIIRSIKTILDENQYFIHTPTISVGVDFNVQDKVDYVVGFFNTFSGVTVETCRQMLRRARHTKEKTYWVHMTDRFTKLPVESEDVEDWLLDQDSMIRTGSEFPKNVPYDDCTDFKLKLKKTLYAKMFVDIQIKKHLSKNDFVGRFIQQMKDAGSSIRGIDHMHLDADPTPQHLKKIKEHETKIRDNIAENIASAPVIDYFKYENLRNREGTADAMPEDRYMLHKYYLMSMFNLPDNFIMTKDWVNLYDSDKEIQVYQNLCRLRNGMEEGLKSEQELEYQIMNSIDPDESKTAGSIHLRAESNYCRLKYACDFLKISGFDSPMSEIKVKKDVIEQGLLEKWPEIQENIDKICVSLGIRESKPKTWNFKNKMYFINKVLNQILGLEVQQISKTRGSLYAIVHKSNVGKRKEIELGIVFCFF